VLVYDCVLAICYNIDEQLSCGFFRDGVYAPGFMSALQSPHGWFTMLHRSRAIGPRERRGTY